MSKHTIPRFVLTTITIGSKQYQSMPCKPHNLGNCDGCVCHNDKTGTITNVKLCMALPCTPLSNAQGEHVIYKELP